MKPVGKLYLSPTSPAVRAVLLTEKALGITTEKIVLDLKKKEHLTPEFLKLNPQHTVPTFVDSDGAVIWDSHAIMPYLVGKCSPAGDSPLYPKVLTKRAVVDQRLHFENGVVYPVLKEIVMPIMMQETKGPTESQLVKVGQIYEFLEAFLEGCKYIAGGELTVADFSIITTLTTLEYFLVIDPKVYPRLFAWVKTMKALPYFEEANAGLQLSFEFFDSLMKKNKD